MKRIELFFIITLALVSPAMSEELNSKSNYQLATFAGGCFWCVEKTFDQLNGVIKTVSGYTGGRTANPTYEEVASKTTGHIEALQITFDPEKISYKELLNVYWRNIDPTDGEGQFCDRGSPYVPVIFFHDEEQQILALESKEEMSKSKKSKESIVTPIVPASAFYPAEEYHQDFYKKNPIRYNSYRLACERDSKLKDIWGDDE